MVHQVSSVELVVSCDPQRPNVSLTKAHTPLPRPSQKSGGWAQPSLPSICRFLQGIRQGGAQNPWRTSLLHPKQEGGFRSESSFSSLSSGTKIQPKEEVLGRTSLRTSRQKLRSGPPKPGKTSISERTSHADVHDKNFGLKNFGLIFRSLVLHPMYVFFVWLTCHPICPQLSQARCQLWTHNLLVRPSTLGRPASQTSKQNPGFRAEHMSEYVWLSGRLSMGFPGPSLAPKSLCKRISVVLINVLCYDTTQCTELLCGYQSDFITSPQNKAMFKASRCTIYLQSNSLVDSDLLCD